MSLTKKRSRITLLSTLVAAGILVWPPQAGAQAGEVHFFNQNGGPRDGVHCTPPFTKCNERVGILRAGVRRSVNCKKSDACKNDEARSAVLIGPINKGWTMIVYDNPDGNKKDDWAEINVIRNMTASDWVTIGTFERSYVEHFVRVTYHRKNGLDGKVSSIEVRP